MKVYGIKNCDTVKKARQWLDKAGIAYDFHDFKKDGISLPLIERWQALVGWEPLINRRGTTWRKLPESVRDNIGADTARQIMLDNPSVIKRPVVELGSDLMVGFNADDWAQKLRADRTT
ncbi:MAG: ArsC family reductase [Oleiphilaceae bacterium]|nr:ArsC family reductase [Oleiphilaceae bacterium]